MDTFNNGLDMSPDDLALLEDEDNDCPACRLFGECSEHNPDVEAR